MKTSVLLFFLIFFSNGVLSIKNPDFKEKIFRHRFLGFTEKSISTMLKDLPPLSLDEFEFRLTNLLLKNIKHETVQTTVNDKLGGYENTFRFNKMYKCLFGNNLLFSTKILIHLIKIKIRQCQKVLIKKEIQLQKMLFDLEKLNAVIGEISSIGKEIMCQHTVTNVNLRIDPILDQLLDTYRSTKLSLIQNLFNFIYEFLSSLLPLSSSSATKLISKKFDESTGKIKKFWQANFQDPAFLSTHFQLVESLFQRVASLDPTLENTEKWGSLFGKFFFCFMKMRFILAGNSAFLTIKKESTSFHSIVRLLLTKIEDFITLTLKKGDSEKIIRAGQQFGQLVSASFLVSNSWFLFFQEREFVLSKIPEAENYNDPFMKTYEKAGYAEVNYRTCSELNEMQEILNIQKYIERSIDSLPFNYDVELITNILDYKPAIDSIYENICKIEAKSCLDSFYAKKTTKKYAEIIYKIHPEFIENLVKLKKTGPITNMGFSQSLNEENYFIKMGYRSCYQTADRSLMIWVCRYCGGSQAISNIRFQRGVLSDFTQVVPHPYKQLIFLQVYKDLVLIVEKTIIDSQFFPVEPSNFFPLSSSTFSSLSSSSPSSSSLSSSTSISSSSFSSSSSYLSNIMWEEDVQSISTLMELGFQDSKTGFLLAFNEWDGDVGDWKENAYPLFFHKPIKEKMCFCLITVGNFTCKKDLLRDYSEYLTYQDSFDEYDLWTFKNENERFNLSKFNVNIKNFSCSLTNVFEVKPNSNFALVDEGNKKILSQNQNDLESMDLYFERVPQRSLYISYEWLNPFGQDDSFQVNLDFIRSTFTQHSLPTADYEKALCDPSTAHFCTFIDDDYLKVKNLLDVHIVGTTSNFEAKNAKFNYGKSLSNQSPLNKDDCSFKNFPNSLETKNILEFGDILEGVRSKVDALIKNECETSVVYSLIIPCPDRLKILKKNGNNLSFVCGDTFKEEQFKDLKPEERIPIQREVFAYIKLDQKGASGLEFNAEEFAQSWNYYFPAYWISFPSISYSSSSSSSTYYLTTTILIRPNIHNNNFIGLTDSFSHDICRDINNDFDRFQKTDESNKNLKSKEHEEKSFHIPKTFIYEHEKSFYHSLKPVKLEDFQDKWGLALGNLENPNLKAFLRKMPCEKARFWVPISWIGDAASSCNPYFSVKSLKVLPNRGLIENCDGNKLPIYRVYYIEVLIYTDPSNNEFENPREIDLNVASKHGYVPYGSKLEEYKVIEGFHVKTRVWVKPKSKVNSLRKIACELNDFNKDDGGETPSSNERDIYSRVVVETKEKTRLNAHIEE